MPLLNVDESNAPFRLHSPSAGFHNENDGRRNRCPGPASRYLPFALTFLRAAVHQHCAAAQGSMLKLKRAYEPVSKDDGMRFLVERLWPRGLSRRQLHLDAWLKDVGPTTELRQWFGHDAKKWTRFCARVLSRAGLASGVMAADPLSSQGARRDARLQLA